MTISRSRRNDNYKGYRPASNRNRKREDSRATFATDHRQLNDGNPLIVNFGINYASRSGAAVRGRRHPRLRHRETRYVSRDATNAARWYPFSFGVTFGFEPSAFPTQSCRCSPSPALEKNANVWESGDHADEIGPPTGGFNINQRCRVFAVVSRM